MPALHGPSRSFQTVFEQLSTGRYFTWSEFQVQPGKPDHAQASGKPSYLLVPAFRVFRLTPGPTAKHEELLSFPKAHYRERISVGQQELALYFEEKTALRAVQNSSLEALIDEYEAEGLVREPQTLAKMAHRYALTMEDCQVRCILELMAQLLDGTGSIPKNTGHTKEH